MGGQRMPQHVRRFAPRKSVQSGKLLLHQVIDESRIERLTVRRQEKVPFGIVRMLLLISLQIYINFLTNQRGNRNISGLIAFTDDPEYAALRIEVPDSKIAQLGATHPGAIENQQDRPVEQRLKILALTAPLGGQIKVGGHCMLCIELRQPLLLFRAGHLADGIFGEFATLHQIAAPCAQGRQALVHGAGAEAACLHRAGDITAYLSGSQSFDYHFFR